MTKPLDIVASLRDPMNAIGRFLRWVALAVVIGLVAGAAGSAFSIALEFVAGVRGRHPWILFLLPLGGLVIAFLYHLARREKPLDTDMVISAVRDEQEPPLVMAPLIFVCTAITHLLGGSAGREGAALQLGGSLGNGIGRLLHLDSPTRRILLMCGMSAAFSALFGTPVAASIFALELTSVGIMYYAALVPCAIASVIASQVALWLGVHPEAFAIADFSADVFQVTTADSIRVLLLSMLCAAVSVLVCFTFHGAARLYKRYLPNLYLRAFVGGCTIIALALLFQTGDYLGSGMPIIERAITLGTARPEAFLLKILFTAVTLGAGYKGGEIVPTFFIGATFGCFAGGLLGLSPALSAALGMAALFCGVTNCPVTTLLLSFELFGFAAPVYFLIAIAVSYALSGYHSLYAAQKIMYDKLEPTFINRETN